MGRWARNRALKNVIAMNYRAPPPATDQQARGPRADSLEWDWDEMPDDAAVQMDLLAGVEAAATNALMSDTDTLFEDEALGALLTGETTVEPLGSIGGDSDMLATNDDSDKPLPPSVSVVDSTVPPKAFSIREALHAAAAAAAAAQPDVIVVVDLYARVLHSARDNFSRQRQHFQFGDLLGGPALLAGTLAD
ncbi:hypothetical protein JDV02_004635 [Purpureocillium takamizusanense]|uniref:Uncharacterized protein n=1 Tax=Purpureocillium takamizusanense TaxID=2060973 RepID=A0A9Q8VB19_9HYPO|nr:uncharacterized protein JDV02_004635 [Purpureocillium takamizusanense]UNI18362.1 hypothetical protein JDV02_004635 [Purpureocillium takamizusanense]